MEREELFARLRRDGLVDATTDPDTIDLDEARTLLEHRQPAAAFPSEIDSPVVDVSHAHDLLHVAGSGCGVTKLQVQQLCHSPLSRQQRWPMSAGCI